MNNAGIMNYPKFELTVDGHEMTWQSNHLGESIKNRENRDTNRKPEFRTLCFAPVEVIVTRISGQTSGCVPFLLGI